MSRYFPESNVEQQASHKCPADCARLVEGTMYVDCEERALDEETVKGLSLCVSTEHLFMDLPYEVDERPLSRCQVCGCWNY